MTIVETTPTGTINLSDDGIEIFSFDNYVPETLQRFSPEAGKRYRLSVLPFKDGENLTPIMVQAKTHYHGQDKSSAPLYGFRCLSTKTHQAECCKHQEEFGKPIMKVAIPVIVYTTNRKGELLKKPKKEATLQVLILSGVSINHFADLNNIMTQCHEDFMVEATKSGNFTNLTFSTAGSAHWLAWDDEEKLLEKSKEWFRKGRELHQSLAQVMDVMASVKTEQEILNALEAPKNTSPSEDFNELQEFH